MTDFLAVRPSRDCVYSYDVHKNNGKCTSGYEHGPSYGGLESVVNAYFDRVESEWEPTARWGKNYVKVAPTFILRW